LNIEFKPSCRWIGEFKKKFWSCIRQLVVRLLVLNSGEVETWKDSSSWHLMAKNILPKTSLMLIHMPFSALYCLIKHTHLKEQAAKS